MWPHMLAYMLIDHFDGTVQFSASKKITDVQSQQPLPSLNGAGGWDGGCQARVWVWKG